MLSVYIISKVTLWGDLNFTPNLYISTIIDERLTLSFVEGSFGENCPDLALLWVRSIVVSDDGILGFTGRQLIRWHVR